MTEPSLFRLQDVSVRRDTRVILDRVSLQVRVGQHTAILGPNGCGKSTLLKLLTREIHPFGGEGSVEILGESRRPIWDIRRLLGIVGVEPVGPLLGTPTVRDMAVSGFLGTFGVTAQYEIAPGQWTMADQALDSVGMGDFADRTVETLSTGERRRTMIARALAPGPKGLVLDEPTAGLDPGAQFRLLRTLSELARQGVTVVIVTHHLEEVIPEIGRVLTMESGRISGELPNLRPVLDGWARQAFGLP